jgi:hypothetical protein
MRTHLGTTSSDGPGPSDLADNIAAVPSGDSERGHRHVLGSMFCMFGLCLCRALLTYPLTVRGQFYVHFGHDRANRSSSLYDTSER